MTIDSKQYKEELRRGYDMAAPGWQKWWKTIETATEEVSRRLVELVQIKGGSKVLDIATGIGEPALTAAKKVGKNKNKKRFDYKTKGMMALIGKKNGVGILFGYKIHGFLAWAILRFYYLSTLPTMQKKLRVMVDWFIDLLFKRDVTRLKTSTISEALPKEKEKGRNS